MAKTEEEKKSKIKVKPYASVKKYSSTPEKDVDVEGTAGDYGINAEVDLGSGFTLSGSLGKSFSKGKVDYPGGSLKFDPKIPDNYSVGVNYTKKFGQEAKPDLKQLVEDKKTKGGLISGKPKVAKRGWK